MKIKNVICAPGKTGFFFDDQKAIKEGATNNGAFYEEILKRRDSADTASGESISIIFVLENGWLTAIRGSAVLEPGRSLFLAEILSQ